MTRSRAKADVAKWNLIRGIQIASCLCSEMIEYVLIGLRTLFSRNVMECKLFGVCVVS